MITIRDILESRQFKDLLSEIKQDIFAEWVDTKSAEEREDLYLRIAAMDRFNEMLNAKLLETTK